jgi:hypothetical protein
VRIFDAYVTETLETRVINNLLRNSAEEFHFGKTAPISLRIKISSFGGAVAGHRCVHRDTFVRNCASAQWALEAALAMTSPEEVFVLSTARLFALLLLIANHAAAQNHLPNDVPLELHNKLEPTGGFTPNTTTTAQLPDATSRQRVVDKKFVAVMGALGGAESLRFTTRKLVLDNEFAAGAPWVTRVPENQHLVAKYGALYATELATVYELKKPHSWLPGDRVIRKLWWAYPAAMVTIHIKNGVGNIRTQGPGGCASVECAEQMQ